MPLYNNASIKDISSLLRGVFGFYDNNGMTIPTRFTPEQLKFYENSFPERYPAALGLAGIVLEFKTDAEEISFVYSTGDTYVTNSGIDIYEDGVFQENLTVEEKKSNIRVTYTRKCKNASEIKIYFPAGVAFYPSNFCLGNATPLPKKEKNILFYGDSITQSAYIPTRSICWCEFVADSLNANYINRGVGSFVAHPGSLPSEPDCSPDYIFVEYGLNDLYLYSLSEALDMIDEYLKKIKSLYTKSKIYVITPNFTPKDTELDQIRNNIDEYCEKLAAIAQKYNLNIIHGNKLIPDLNVMFWSDHVHLSEAGAAVFAHNVVKYMK